MLEDRELQDGSGTTPFALGFGANLGDSRATIAAAIGRLEGCLGPLEVAPFYRGPAESRIPQPDFLNTVAIGRTGLPPDAILALGKMLELEAGRRRGIRRHEPRPLDIDLLLYGDRVSRHPELTLPHPALVHRPFVLLPLSDLAPDLPIPPDGKTVSELAARIATGELVRIDP